MGMLHTSNKPSLTVPTGARCQGEFCWLCMVDYNQVRLRGILAHRADCPYRGTRSRLPMARLSTVVGSAC